MGGKYYLFTAFGMHSESAESVQRTESERNGFHMLLLLLLLSLLLLLCGNRLVQTPFAGQTPRFLNASQRP